MHILAIETSCDETAGAVVEVKENTLSVRSNIISSQVALHAKWGGVVPNLAAREHTKNIIPVLIRTLEESATKKDDIDLIAVTNGPGLIPALLSGVSAAKSLAYVWKKPLMGVHHIEGHIYANWIKNEQKIQFPVLALVVSGGHTQLVLMKEHCDYNIIGQTQDDAVGEAFDKVARILGLGYPGGPIISKRAQIFEVSGRQNDITLPQPMRNSGDYNFSFSGIKTAVLYLVKDFRKQNNLSDDEELPQDFVDTVANAFQTAVTQILTTKTLKAAQKHNVKSILLAGGVSANEQLRHHLQQNIAKHIPSAQFFAPSMTYCLDNATMIAAAAYYRWKNMTHTEKKQLQNGWQDVVAHARYGLIT